MMRDIEGDARPYSLPSGSVIGASPTPSPSLPDGPAPIRIPARIPADDVRYPKSGPGTFVYANGTGAVLGSAGTIKPFRIAVESNVVNELGEFAATVERTLGDPRSWIASKEQRFQRVPAEARADFTVSLVTRETAYQLCGTGGLDIRVGGVPYTSCQVSGRVVINLDRWRESVPDYVSSGATLEEYRQYVVNHEVGHVLGYPHEPCPGAGRPAPVMQQQTLGLNGCTPNSWAFP